MCWKPEYIILIIISTLIDYSMALLMGKEKKRSGRKKYLIISLFSNLGLLFAFKYFNFFDQSIGELLNTFNIFYEVSAYKILLPVGISFYTFQTLSYSIDVYRGKKKPEKHLGIFAVYVSFFPQLVAGPIERSEKLLPQFRKKIDFDYNRVTDGLKLILWGFFKKIVIADRLAVIVDRVYNNVGDYEGFTLLIATLAFSIQIYCDFSGYSDIAIGSAKIMGYDLMENFRRPYYSKSIGEFWRRWHISLSTWFKDYLYIPLGGSRVSKNRIFFNLFVTFLISGLWHGANWTYIFWGALHGSYLIVEKLTEKFKLKITNLISNNFKKYIQIIFTFSLISFAWIFFRANNVSDAFLVIEKMFSNFDSYINFNFFFNSKTVFGLGKIELIITFLSVMILEGFHFIQSKGSIRIILSKQVIYIRWMIYLTILFWIILFGEFGKNQFIYFQF